jgi:hypothetical protein
VNKRENGKKEKRKTKDCSEQADVHLCGILRKKFMKKVRKKQRFDGEGRESR